MRKKHFTSSQCDAFILQPGEVGPKGAICFAQDEWDYAMKLSKANAASEPEAEKIFWSTLLDKKRLNPRYTIYEDFPLDVSEAKVSPAALYCPSIIAQLRGAGAGRKESQ